MRIVIVSGGFDPVHSGHIRMFNAAKAMGDKLVVGINSENWLIRKKGYAFLPWLERRIIIENMKSVDYTYAFGDIDNTAVALIKNVQDMFGYQNSYIFANGGDRDETNIPEMDMEYKYPIEFKFGVGGRTKLNSSSNLTRRLIDENPNHKFRFMHGFPIAGMLCKSK